MVVAVETAAATSASSAGTESLLPWSDVRSRNVTRALRAHGRLVPGCRTGAAPARSGLRLRTSRRSAPRHPARHTLESTAGLLARGSVPVAAFPGMTPVAWHGLAAYSCGGSCGIGTLVPHRIPCSLSCERPSTPTVSGAAGRFVNVIVGRSGLGWAGAPILSKNNPMQSRKTGWRDAVARIERTRVGTRARRPPPGFRCRSIRATNLSADRPLHLAFAANKAPEKVAQEHACLLARCTVGE